MKLTGCRWNMICLALLGVLLFSSCASSPQGTAQTASADSSAEEQTAPGEDETLRDQSISTLNLCQPQNRVVASDSLDESASFLAGIILENSALYAVSDGSRVLEDMLGDFAYAYLYDGSLSVTQVGRLALETLQGSTQTSQAGETNEDEESSAPASRVRAKKNASLNDILTENVQRIVSLSVVRAENENYSIWLLLVQARNED